MDPGASPDVATALQISATTYDQIMTVPYSECLAAFVTETGKKVDYHLLYN